MKVFVTCGKHPLKSSGGYATYVHSLCNNLKALGHEVNILAISNNNKIEETEIGRIYNITNKFLPKNSSTLITGTSFIWSKIFDSVLQRLISQNDEKCMIFGIGPWALSGINSKIKFKDRVRLTNVFFTSVKHETLWLMKGANVRDYGIFSKIKYSIIYFFSNFILHRLEKKILKHSNAIVIHNEFPKKILMDGFNIESKKIIKIPYNIETFTKKSSYRNYDISINIDDEKGEKSEMICVSVCRQEPRKGINFFIKAMKIIKDRNLPIRAIIIGSGDLLQNNMNIAKKLDLDDIITFTGFVPDITEYLSKADVLVQPSLQESSGSVSILEALQFGIPVIATLCDAIPEDVSDGISGILVPKEDEKALANAIIKLYEKKTLAIQMGKNGKKFMEENFNKNGMKDGLKLLEKKIWID